jgi:hypothetical protein
MNKSKKGKEKTSDSGNRSDGNDDPTAIPVSAAKTLTRQLKEKDYDETFQSVVLCCLWLGSGGCSCGKWLCSGCCGFLKLVAAFMVALFIFWLVSMFTPQQGLSNTVSYFSDVFSRKLQQRAV